MDSSSAGSDPGSRPAFTGERMIPGAQVDSIVEAEHLARYQLACALAKGRRVLDVPCGTGYGSAMMARAVAQSVTGVDIDPPTVAWANEDYWREADFEVADMLSLPFGEASFDLVASFEGIEHVSVPSRALDEMARVLTEDGVLVVSTPNRSRNSLENPFHFRELTADELEEELRARFAHVRLLGQRMHLASVISVGGAEDEHGSDSEAEAGLRRLAGAVPGDEIFTIGLASQRPLPEPPRTSVTLTDGQSLNDWHGSALAWRARAFAAEASVEQAQTERAHSAMEWAHLKEELLEVRLREKRR